MKLTRFLILLGTVALSAITSVVDAAPGTTGTTGANSVSRLPVKEVTVFKDGHAFVVHEGALPTNESGSVVLDSLPAPVIGTFWAYSTDETAKVSRVVAGPRRRVIERTALTISEMIEGNPGAEVEVTETDGTKYPATLIGQPVRLPEEPAVTNVPDSPEPAVAKSPLVMLKTPAGIKAFQSIMDQLCKSFSRPSEKKGAVAGWIIGNEVNAHHEWYNCGPSDPDEVVAEYHKALRIAHASLKRANAPGRIYASFEHHWAMQPSPNPKQSIPGKTFLQELMKLSKAHGDFDWHLAYHPYPENLFEPRSWLDKTTLPNLDTRKITFKNLEQLSAWANIPNNLYQGTSRRIILSEQGFHGKPGSPGEQNQAAGYVYGYRKAHASKNIDAFILHRHVDHAKEGGLMLGLHSNAPGSISTPLAKKEIWQVFHDAGTPNELQSFEKYKKILGDNAWNEINPKLLP